jgi:hypothetical protein
MHCHELSTWTVYTYVCDSQVTAWCEHGFSLMNNIKIKSRNHMNTDTLDDRMMICSNGSSVWAYPGVLRPRAGGVEVEVHNMLRATDRAEEENLMVIYVLWHRILEQLNLLGEMMTR